MLMIPYEDLMVQEYKSFSSPSPALLVAVKSSFFSPHITLKDYFILRLWWFGLCVKCEFFSVITYTFFKHKYTIVLASLILTLKEIVDQCCFPFFLFLDLLKICCIYIFSKDKNRQDVHKHMCIILKGGSG